MSAKNIYPADVVPPKPFAEVSKTQTEFIRKRELGGVATGPVWTPSQLDIEYFNRGKKGE